MQIRVIDKLKVFCQILYSPIFPSTVCAKMISITLDGAVAYRFNIQDVLEFARGKYAAKSGPAKQAAKGYQKNQMLSDFSEILKQDPLEITWTLSEQFCFAMCTLAKRRGWRQAILTTVRKQTS